MPAVPAYLIPALQYGTQEAQPHSGPFSTQGFNPPNPHFLPSVSSFHSFCSCLPLMSNSSVCNGKHFKRDEKVASAMPILSLNDINILKSTSNSPASLPEPQPSKRRRCDESSIKLRELHLGLQIKSHRSRLAQEQRQ